ncbi:aminotransferase class I/II-fold pyridoxal phosphate-dependent enzyme [Clostridium sp. AM18-55]|uniref:aminotransferase class I/II-fold pyridoxal phosphate-dependent enzyme n=1 Tax=Clostridium sp. AM18-55 TaxID=2293023 RepID=UPI001A9A30D6|nr:aminotransferase class I/II-fold pyridoxal phosphate-dependent enzyme [Clostridium sp. AM18-55]
MSEFQEERQMEEERRNLEPGVGRSTRRRREASGQKETGEGSRRDDALTQERAPIYEALEAFQKMRVVPFDVPGHKRGRGNPELTKLLGETCMRLDVNSMKPLDNLCHPVSVIADAEQLAAEAFGAAHAFLMVGGTTSAVQSMVLTKLLGETCMRLDVNSMKPLDNLCHPVSVIADAEQLAAEAFGAAHAFLMVGGTTSAVQSMVLTAVKRGEKIILPRNVHRSVMGAMVLGGAVPVYVNPAGDKRLGIPLGMRVEDVRRAIKENPDAKAVFVNNPTYYGICSDLRSIVKLAHEHGMLCLVDEAHGTHFYFGENMPVSAMAAGADMAAVSMHKSGGSLTQSSILLTGPGMSAGYVRQIINLTQTTSGSYLLLSSLDISRRNLALRGREAFKQVVELAEYARTEINRIGGYYAYSKELINGDSIYDFDVTKLSIHTRDIGLAGIEVYDLLRDEYDIQAEFGDLGNILAYLSIGDRQREVERLVSALAEIKRRFSRDKSTLMDFDYIDPIVAMSPQEAFYGEKESLPIRETAGRVCSEFVMCYPPGIPILTPGEQITEEIIDYIAYALEKGCSMTGPEDPEIERLNVLK